MSVFQETFLKTENEKPSKTSICHDTFAKSENPHFQNKCSSQDLPKTAKLPFQNNHEHEPCAPSTHDLRRRYPGPQKTQSYRKYKIARLRHARSPQRVARAASKRNFTCIPHLRRCTRISENTILHAFRAFGRAISAKGCAGGLQNAILPACAPSTRTTSAKGCAGMRKNAILAACRAFDARDLRRGLRGQPPEHNFTCILRPRLTPFVPLSAFF